MSSINNLAVSVRSALAYRWAAFLRDLPFRMRIGLFGIWLMKVGRFLQVKYANWNSEFRLEVEPPHPSLPEYCKIHVSERVTFEHTLTFSGFRSQERLQTPLVQALFCVKGIEIIILGGHSINLKRGRVFSWQELLPEVERVILEHLTAKQT